MSIIGGIANVFASGKKKEALSKAFKINAKMAMITSAKTADDIKDQLTYSLEQIRVEEKLVSGRQKLFYAAAGLELTSKTPMSQFLLTETVAAKERKRLQEDADEELAYNKEMLKWEIAGGYLKMRNAQHEVTLNAWTSLAGTASSSVSSYMDGYSSQRTAAATLGSGSYGETIGASALKALGSLWG